ncbi:TfoX/Sxy family protein [Microbacterium luticocti]|uniref:TfoX/Sxy family protein n=1 Tax=Microbacterium luticocti TaxID=451764 RepID=UPI00048ACF6A|nr:TfoX/Sxy family protein [Microbacterium luticocti]
MSPEQVALLGRIRRLLTDESVVREVSMFGGRSIMLNGKMIASARGDGALLVRVDANRHDDLLHKPGASQARMGPGRDMGPGWIEVAADAIGDDRQLEWWIGVAQAYNRVVTDDR